MKNDKSMMNTMSDGETQQKTNNMKSEEDGYPSRKEGAETWSNRMNQRTIINNNNRRREPVIEDWKNEVYQNQKTATEERSNGRRRRNKD